MYLILAIVLTWLSAALERAAWWAWERTDGGRHDRAHQRAGLGTVARRGQTD